MDHAHPCNFRLVRALDRGWGEMAFEYHWDSTSSIKGEDGQSNPDLDACTLYEYTTYPRSEAIDIAELPATMQTIRGELINQGRHDPGWYYPHDPPFAAWKFRDPTDGRTAPVALGCFSAVNGWAWDRHKMAGSLHVPEHTARSQYLEHDNFAQEALDQVFVIAALQEYRFHCDVCGINVVVASSHSGPHVILRSFGPRCMISTLQTPFSAPPVMRGDFNVNPLHNKNTGSPDVWRYSFHKHQATAYLDIDAAGYVDDSAHIGFGP